MFRLTRTRSSETEQAQLLTADLLREELAHFMEHSLEPALDRLMMDVRREVLTSKVHRQDAQDTRSHGARRLSLFSTSSAFAGASNIATSDFADLTRSFKLPIHQVKLKGNKPKNFVNNAGDIFAPLDPIDDVPDDIGKEPMLLEGPRSTGRMSDRSSYTQLCGSAEDESPRTSPIREIPRREDQFRLPVDMHTGLCAWCESIVHSTWFDIFFAIMIMLNSITIGIEVDLQARAVREADSTWMSTALHNIDAIFCLIFSAELIFRFSVFGCGFFERSVLLWNAFDLLVCTLQILEQLARCSASFQIPLNASTFRILRMLRMVRISRMVRLLESLRTLLSSMVSSLVSLGSTVCLLMLFLYISSVFITQIVVDAGETPHSEQIRYWYGSLGRTYLTMFESIFSGVDWDTPIGILMLDISPWIGVLHCLFVAFCNLSILNMATGVFVDCAMRKARQDNDINTAQRISELFFNDPRLAEPGKVTYEEFRSKIDTPEMQEYFLDINVDPSAARFLYQMLDLDGNGHINAEELLEGCMRIRGEAKALEIQLLLHENDRMFCKMLERQHSIMDHLTRLSDQLGMDSSPSDIEEIQRKKFMARTSVQRTSWY